MFQKWNTNILCYCFEFYHLFITEPKTERCIRFCFKPKLNEHDFLLINKYHYKNNALCKNNVKLRKWISL